MKQISTASPSQSLASGCPFCGSERLKPALLAEDEFQGRFPMSACCDCGTHFLSPMPTSGVLARAYATAYYGEGETKFGGVIERLRDTASSGRALSFARQLPTGGSVLDIGCGDGRLLRQLSKSGKKLDLHGIELPGPAAKRASSIPGVHLHLGALDTVDFRPETFDLITMVHVIEHLPLPGVALEKIGRWLKPGGRLFLAFPNISSWQARLFGPAWFHLDPPRHLTLVPPTSMIEVLAQAGFESERIRHWCPEQNLYGWIQSVLNRFDPVRNLLYERLKRNRHYAPSRKLAVWWQLPLAGLMAPIALFVDVLAASNRSGATVELTSRKKTPANVS